jgi:hypothetical protein
MTEQAPEASVTRELLGGGVAAAIAIAGFLPPLVHFVTGPLGPFIGAFVVAQRVKPGVRGCAIIALTLGAVFASVGAAVATAFGGFGSSSPPDWLPAREVLGAILGGVAAYAVVLGGAGAAFGTRFGAQREASGADGAGSAS